MRLLSLWQTRHLAKTIFGNVCNKLFFRLYVEESDYEIIQWRDRRVEYGYAVRGMAQAYVSKTAVKTGKEWAKFGFHWCGIEKYQTFVLIFA